MFSSFRRLGLKWSGFQGLGLSPLGLGFRIRVLRLSGLKLGFGL